MIKPIVLLAGTCTLLALLAGASGTARAELAGSLDIIPAPLVGTPTPNGSGDWTWTFGATLHELQRIETGNYFTIYDFAGFTGVSATPIGWAFTSSQTGVTPGDVLPIDNPSVPNLTWMRTGEDILPGPDGIDLGLFSADSHFNRPLLGWFASQGTKNVEGPANGTKVSNVGRVRVPGPTIPEPSSLALCAMGLLGVAFYGTQRRKSV